MNNQTNNVDPQSTASCMDASDPDSMPFATAQQRIIDAITPLNTTIKQPLRAALDYILAEDLISPINVPPHINSAMDGFALNAKDLPSNEAKQYAVPDTAFAGAAYQGTYQTGQAIRIMTGAMMPNGTDTVVIQEQCEDNGSNVRIGTGHQAQQNVRQAGEDIAQGQVVLSKGTPLTPARLGLVASLGIAEVATYRRPRVAYFSTGDELRSIGEPLEQGCIYDSNRYTLYGMLKNLDVDILDFGTVKDDPAHLEKVLTDASLQADIVISSGGVSVGQADYIKPVLQSIGDINFWKLAIKPGRPLTFGTLNSSFFFVFPGNPVAVMVTFYQFVQPAIYKLSGQSHYQPIKFRAKADFTLNKRPGRTEFIRGILAEQSNGELYVRKTGKQGSGILTSMSLANCLIILDEAQGAINKGDDVYVQMLPS